MSSSDLLSVGSRLRWCEVLGKIIAQEGGLVSFCTPHGTVLKMGLLHIARDAHALTESEAEQLSALEADASANGVLYGGLPAGFYGDPTVCPWCAGTNVVFITGWSGMTSDDDPTNKVDLDEFQCKDCAGRSFWV